jgi:hypothetical protein
VWAHGTPFGLRFAGAVGLWDSGTTAFRFREEVQVPVKSVLMFSK